MARTFTRLNTKEVLGQRDPVQWLIQFYGADGNPRDFAHS
jgi:hypothetical protein